MGLAEATARRHLSFTDEGKRLNRLYEVILNSRPTTGEKAELLAFVRKTNDRLTEEGEPEPAMQAWSLLCHAMFSMSRFQYLE